MASSSLAPSNPYGSLVPVTDGDQADMLRPANEAKESVQKFEKKQDATLSQMVAGHAKTRQAISGEQAKADSLVPPTMDLPPKPEVKPTNPVEQWGSAAMVFAALGSLMTRRPMLTALNAASGVMKAYASQDKAAQDQATEEWKVATANAIKMADYQMSIYKTALERSEKKENMSLGEQAADDQAVAHVLTAHATALHDEIMVSTLQADGIKGAKELLEKRDLSKLNVQKAQEEADKYGAVQKLIETMKADPEFQKLPPTEQAERVVAALSKGSAYNKSQAVDAKEATGKALAEGIMAGRDAPDLGHGVIDSYAKKYMEEKQFNYLDRQLQYKTALLQMKALSTPRVQDMAARSISANQLIDRTKESARELQKYLPLGPTGIAFANKAQIDYLANTQSNTPAGQAAIRFRGDISALKDEYTTIINSGFAPTQNTWAQTNQQLNGDYEIGGLMAGLGEVQWIMKSRLQAYANLDKFGPGSKNQYTGSSGAAGWGETTNPEAQKQQPKKVTEEEYNALDSGTQFTDPNGVIRTKP